MGGRRREKRTGGEKTGGGRREKRTGGEKMGGGRRENGRREAKISLKSTLGGDTRGHETRGMGENII